MHSTVVLPQPALQAALSLVAGEQPLHMGKKGSTLYLAGAGSGSLAKPHRSLTNSDSNKNPETMRKLHQPRM